MPPGYADPGRNSDSQEDEIIPVALLKSVRNNDRNGERLRHWRSVKNNRAEDNENDDDVGERGATADDDR